MEHLTQSFLDLSWLRQDSWERHPGFIASKNSLNPQVLITKDQGWIYDLYMLQYKNNI